MVRTAVWAGMYILPYRQQFMQQVRGGGQQVQQGRGREGERLAEKEQG